MNAFPLANAEIESVDWSRLRECSGFANNVPVALRGLIAARDGATIERCYWQLENHIVVQGNVYESAEYVVPVILAALIDGIEGEAKTSLLELLFQIVAYGTRDEEAGGEASIAARCRDRAREGLWLLYGELGGVHGNAAYEILESIEPNGERLAAVAALYPGVDDAVFRLK